MEMDGGSEGWGLAGWLVGWLVVRWDGTIAILGFSELRLVLEDFKKEVGGLCNNGMS